MSVKMKFGSKDIPFVYKGDKLIYPNPIKDGLLLWYDFKGMRNTDTNKEVAKDLSGNGNDGTLTNFNFTEESGYQNNRLKFDGVDDKLQIPELNLDETAMSVELNGKTYSYDGDKVVSVDEGGHTVAHEKNLVKSGRDNWRTITSTISEFTDEYIEIDIKEGIAWNALMSSEDNAVSLKKGENYTISYELMLFDTVNLGIPQLGFSNYGLPNAGTVIGNSINKLINLNLTNEWQYLETTITSTVDEDVTAYLRFGIPEKDTKIRVRRIAINKGNKVSYSPAPEDFIKTEIKTEISPLSSLQLYNKPLNKTELLHNVGKQSPKELKEGQYVQDGLVLHYDFSHESNTSEYKGKAFDYSGNGNHGELQNFNFTEESGYVEDGLKFDGVDDQVIIPYENNTFSVDFTWSAVIKPYIVDKDMMFMYGSTTAQYFRIQNGKLGASVRGQDSPVAYALTSFALDANTAYHVVLSHTNGEFKIYANGEQVGESDRGMKNERYRLSWIGKYTSADPRAFEGEILSVQVHNKALSPEEIAHNYAIEKEKFNII